MTQEERDSRSMVAGDASPGHPSAPAVARVRLLAGQMRERCLRLDELSSDMAQHPADQPPRSIVGLLAEREPLVSELAGLGDELAAILNDPASARDLGEREHRQIRSRLSELELVMARIRERDRETRAALQRRRDGLADQLASVNIHRGAARAYSGAGRPVNPTVQDGVG